MDYIIADKTVIPPENQPHFSEKAVYLPHCFQVNDAHRKISDRVFAREECGLPPSGFVFCCFNNSYKIQPATFAAWMRMLKAVEGSVLWLFAPGATLRANLCQEAEGQGVNSQRLVFAERVPLEDYLARYRVADLFLDTLPYNAGTTASDALWAGLPVLTCMGKAFAARMAASLLKTLELPELITHSKDEYEQRAVTLALHPKEMKTLRNKLASKRLTTPLFDCRLFARHLESAYEAMMARHHAGLPPDVIEIAP